MKKEQAQIEAKVEVKVEIKSKQEVIKKAKPAPKKDVKKESLKLSQQDMEKVRPIFKKLMMGCLARRRFKLSLLAKKTQVIAKF